MSYILDALRRSQADRERERGQVPGLNTQAAPAAPATPSRGGKPALWLAAGLALGGVATVAALWPRREAAAPAPVVAVPVPPVVAEPRPATPAAQSPAPLPVVVSAPPAPGPTAPVAAAPAPVPTAATAPAPATARVLPWAELSAEQKRELPPLVVGGSIWSDSAISRFVIFNGQVVREGELAAPGVTLERIAPKSALLRWRDLRFEVPL